MDFLTCVIINGPLVTLNIMVDVFYIFCMLYPPHGEKIKQPQKLLLSCVVFCTMIYLLSALLLCCFNVTAGNFYCILTLYAVHAWSLCTSMGSVVWLNFFYCTQIVPAQTALFTWIKKHIKHIIYCVWCLDRIFGSFSIGVMVIDYLVISDPLHFSPNVTLLTGSVNIQVPYPVSQTYEYQIALYFVLVYFLFHVCIMMFSNSSTVIYLGKHICHMLANSQSFSCPQFRGQVRVTVIGILQGVLYLSFSTWNFYRAFVRVFSEENVNSYVRFTVVNFYATGSLFTLGAVQSVFRQRFKDIWLRVTQIVGPMLPW